MVAVFSLVALYVVLRSQITTNIGNPDVLFQVAAFKPFAEGNYDGTTTFAELAKHGDFGLGTLNGLDGEMVAVDGVFYQVGIDGVPREVASWEETPFSVVTFFEADHTLHVLDSMNYSELTVYIDQIVSPEVALYAIRIQGEFDYAKARSVPKQTEPYPVLAEVVENQVIFPLFNVTGTVVGSRLPSYMAEVNVAGYHFHFISDDKFSGGHLLDCVVRNATIQIDYAYDYELLLNETP